MKVKAEARYQRISFLKVKRVLDIIRGKRLREALSLLKFLPHAGARIVENVVKSAAANAKNNYKLDEENLWVSEAYVGEAGMLKRYQPRARGRAFPIHKRMSHVTVFVAPKGSPLARQEKVNGSESKS